MRATVAICYTKWVLPVERRPGTSERGVVDVALVVGGSGGAKLRDDEPMTTTPTPLVTREALLAFTQQLVEHYAPERVILFGSLARGEARWNSDADILVVMPFEGRHLAKIREMRRLCPVRFPLDLLVRRPEEVEVRYRGGDPVVREALDHGEMLHG